MHAKYLVYKPPRRIKYVVAIDYTKNRQQKAIIKAISKGIGNGLVANESFDPSYFEKVPNFDEISLSL